MSAALPTPSLDLAPDVPAGNPPAREPKRQRPTPPSPGPDSTFVHGRDRWRATK